MAVLPVLELAALHLAGHDYARRQVRQADGGRGLVDVLPARARGAENLHLDVLGPDLDLPCVRHLRHDLHRRKAGLPCGP